MAATPAVVVAAAAVAAGMAPSSTTTQAASTVGNAVINTREVHKNGWLKKVPSRERRAAPFVKPAKLVKMWVVFCIHDDVNAFLEYYDSRRSAFSHRPTRCIALSSCVHVSPNIVVHQEQEPDFVFSIALDSEVIKLAAASRDQMSEWIDALKNKLTEIGVLQPRCNLYTKAPESRLSLASNRDPTSPLPPPPVAPRPFNSIPRASSEPSSPTFVLVSGTEISLATPPLPTISRQHMTLPLSFSLPGRRSSNTSQPTSPMTSPISPQSAQQLNSASSTATPPSILQHREQQLDIGRSGALLPVTVSNNNRFDFDAANLIPSPTSVTAQSNNANNNNNNNVNGDGGRSETLEHINDNTALSASHYEPIFLATSTDRLFLCGVKNPSYFNPPPPTMSSSFSSSSLPFPPPPPPPPPTPPRSVSRPRAASEERPPTTALSESSTHTNGNSNLQLNEGDEMVSDENKRPITLREKQTFLLCREISSPGGVRLLLPRKDCVNTIAFVEILGAVWISGWKQREHPFLYHSFHIGDRLLKVGGREVRCVQEVHRTIRAEPSYKLEFIIARVPYGQVYALKREADGQDLGLVRDGNTAEIIDVTTGGLAFRCGLPAKASSCSTSGLCNWVITEINDRPLNLFFKDREVQDRLNAVGKEISILVQPSDFVKSLKKQLKSIWGYKDYIVQ